MSKNRAVGWCVYAGMMLGLSSNVTALDPSGLVDAPREGSYGGKSLVNARDAEFNFEGLTNFPGSQGYVQIQVLDYGDLSADLNGPWRDKLRVVPQETPFDYNGEEGAPRYLWESGPVQLFRPFSTSIFRLPGTFKFPWRNESTARVRFIAVATDAQGRPVARRYMRTFDKAGVPTTTPRDGHMVLTHFSEGNSLNVIPKYTYLDGDPFTLGRDKGIDLRLFNKNNRPQLSQFSETISYYEAVKIDENGMGPSIREALRDLASFKKRYFEDVSEECRNKDSKIILRGGEAHATYFNQGDLGLGRDMHCTRNGCTKETACYVANFGAVEDILEEDPNNPGQQIVVGEKGIPYFNDIFQAKQALDRDRPFAVVAMVERGRLKKDDLNQVFFVVYSDYSENPDNPNQGPTNPGLGDSAKLDFTGYNTFIPGNCMACHGIGSTYTNSRQQDSRQQGGPSVKSARFLPFDLSAFRYFSDDLANPLSRAAQDGQFFALNYLISNTSILEDNPELSELIQGWYTPSGRARAGLFNDEFVPQGWSDKEEHKQLYLKTVATACRSCHVSHVDISPLRFSTFESFNMFKNLIVGTVCGEHRMPNAEQSTRNLWRNEGRAALLDRLDIVEIGCPRESGLAALVINLFSATPQSSSSTAEVRQSALVIQNKSILEVSQAYKEEKCACTTRECGQAVEDKFVAEFVQADRSDQSTEEQVASLQGEAFECNVRLLDHP